MFRDTLVSRLPEKDREYRTASSYYSVDHSKAALKRLKMTKEDFLIKNVDEYHLEVEAKHCKGGIVGK